MDALNILAGKSESERATLSKANREIYRLMQDKRLSLDEVKARAAKVMDPLLPVFSPDKSTHEMIRTQIMSQAQRPYLRTAPQSGYRWDVACCQVPRHRALRRDG